MTGTVLEWSKMVRMLGDCQEIVQNGQEMSGNDQEMSEKVRKCQEIIQDGQKMSGNVLDMVRKWQEMVMKYQAIV